MVLLDHLWDDTVTGASGPQPQRSLNKVYTKPFNIKDIRVEGSIKYQRSLSMPSPTPVTVRKENVFHHVGANWSIIALQWSKHHEKVV